MRGDGRRGSWRRDSGDKRVRNHLDAIGSPEVRSAHYRKFDAEVEAPMEVLAEYAVGYARDQHLDLRGVLA